MNKIKTYLLNHNIKALMSKISKGTATKQDIDSLERMCKYRKKGHW